MRSINKVILIGNLTRDPDLKMTASGQPIVTFGIATNREWISRDGQRHTSTEFHEIVAWSKLAELCAKHLRKGKLVYIEGYLKTRSWETPEGIKKFRTEIVANDMIMLEKRSHGEDSIAAAPMTSEEMMANGMPEDMPPLEDMPLEEEPSQVL